jgi:hypothetical protein
VAKKLYNAAEGFLASKTLDLSLSDEAFLALDESVPPADRPSFLVDSATFHFVSPDDVPRALGPGDQLPSYAMPDLPSTAFHAEASASDGALVHALASDTLVFKPLDAIQASVPPYAPGSDAPHLTVAELFATGGAAELFASAGPDSSAHPLPAYDSVLHTDTQTSSAVQAAATHAAAQATDQSPGLDPSGRPLPPYNSVLFDNHAATQAAQGDTLWFI